MIKYLISFLLLTFSLQVFSQPHTKTIFKLDKYKHTLAQVINKTNINLRCYIAIDGYKYLFIGA